MNSKKTVVNLRLTIPEKVALCNVHPLVERMADSAMDGVAVVIESASHVDEYDPQVLHDYKIIEGTLADMFLRLPTLAHVAEVLDADSRVDIGTVGQRRNASRLRTMRSDIQTMSDLVDKWYSNFAEEISRL